MEAIQWLQKQIKEAGDGKKGSPGDNVGLGLVILIVGGALTYMVGIIIDFANFFAAVTVGVVAGTLVTAAFLFQVYLAIEASWGIKSRAEDEASRAAKLQRELDEAKTEIRFLRGQTDVGRTSTTNPR